MKKNFLWLAVSIITVCSQIADTNASSIMKNSNISLQTSLNSDLDNIQTVTIPANSNKTINQNCPNTRYINLGNLTITGNCKIGGAPGLGTALQNGDSNSMYGQKPSVIITKDTVIPIKENGVEIENITSIKNLSGSILQNGGYVGQVFNNANYIYGGGKLRAFRQDNPNASIKIINGTNFTLKDGFHIRAGTVTVGEKNANDKPQSNGTLTIAGSTTGGGYHLAVGEGLAKLDLLNNYSDGELWCGSVIDIVGGSVILDGRYVKWEGDIHLYDGTLELKNIDNSKRSGSLLATGGTLIQGENVNIGENTGDYIAPSTKVIKKEMVTPTGYEEFEF